MKKNCVTKMVVCMMLALLVVQSFKTSARAEETSSGNANETVYYNGHVYSIFEEGVSWDEARDACEKRGGYLVCINDEEEQKFIQTIVADSSFPYYWIGLSDAETEGSFKWINGDPLTFTNWNIDQPDNLNDSEDSVMIPNRDMHYSQWDHTFGTWNDMNSNGDQDHSLSDMGYICEWDSIEKLLRNRFK